MMSSSSCTTVCDCAISSSTAATMPSTPAHHPQPCTLDWFTSLFPYVLDTLMKSIPKDISNDVRDHVKQVCIIMKDTLKT